MSEFPEAHALVGASAPGKLMISGEYAVLEGAVAIVASVDVRARARWVDDPSAILPPEARETRNLAQLALGTLHGHLSIDASDLRRSGRKLGLGSSAAASAAVAGAVLASHGQDLTDPAVQRRVLELALAGHKAIAPEGSGADVAAASLGGFVRFRLENGKLAEAERVEFPRALHTRVVWTGKEARTSEFVRAVREFEARDARAFAFLRDDLRDQAARFAEAIARGDAADVIAAASAYGLGMGQLGRSAGVDIVTPELAKIAVLAKQHGGGAKPSGAGGGDVAIALFPSSESAEAFDAACDEAGLDRLDLRLGAPGVCREQ
ncbi:MAG: Phosphomevalonate kinase [Myxococcaceae bacterium]|nr:Phosphomevalonate kinase [Myxococcaceae bacterium]